LIEVFGVEKGLIESDALFATAFNIVLEKVIRDMETKLNGTIFNRTIQCTANADNVLILGLSVRATEEVVAQINEAAVNTGLVIKESKTKYVKITRNITNLVPELNMDGQVFEVVQNSRFLSVLIIQN
jgi:hypothetical protein